MGETAARGIAADDRLGPAGGQPEDLEIDVVLVRPEPGQLVVARVLAERCLGGDDRLVLRVRPRLEAHTSIETREWRVGAVAGGEDFRVGRAALLVHDDAVVDDEPRVTRERDVRLEADADHYRVGFHRAAVRESYRERAAVFDRFHADSEADPDAFALVARAEECRDSRRYGACAETVERFNDHHRRAAFARGRSDLEPDPAAADDRQLLSGTQRLADRKRVLDRAEVERARRVAAGHPKTTRCAAGRQDELVVGDGASVGERDALRGSIDLRRPRADAKVEIERGVLRRLEEVGRLRRGVAGEHRLRKRRALVRRVRLGTDEDDAAGVAFAAQRLRRPAARLSGADDRDRARAHYGAAFARRLLPSIPPITAHSANASEDCSKSRGAHSPSSWSSSV